MQFVRLLWQHAKRKLTFPFHGNTHQSVFEYLTALISTLLQVVVKTRTEYQTEKKRLKVPKVEEFTISFTDGVSERLKVRIYIIETHSVLNYPRGL